MDDKKLEQSILNDIPASDLEPTEPSKSILTSEQQTELNKELALEKKYGDQNLRTLVERTASAASFGLTDQAIVEGTRALYGEKEAQKAQEGLRERDARNREAAIAGEVVGVLAPAALSGGTSLAAKAVGSGVRTAAKAGVAAEKATAKGLAKILSETGKSKTAKDVILKSISKGTGSAVEGAAYGFGELLKEDALGNADFNAENLTAYTGTGALFGGAAGGLFGAVEAAVPIVKNGKIVDFVNKKIRSGADRTENALQFVKADKAARNKLEKTPFGQQVKENLSRFLSDDVGLPFFENPEKFATRLKSVFKQKGENIGKILTKVDDRLKKMGPESEFWTGTQIAPTRSKVANRTINYLEELRDELKVAKLPTSDANKINKSLDDAIRGWKAWVDDASPMSAKDLREMKTTLQQAARYTKTFDELPIVQKIKRVEADSARDEMFDLAERMSTVDNQLASELRQANLDYATAKFALENAEKKAADQYRKNFTTMRDFLFVDAVSSVAGGGSLGLPTLAFAGKKFFESDFKRKLVLLSNIEKANKSINSTINSSIKNFFKKTKSKAAPTSTKVLLSADFGLPDEKKEKVSSKKEGFEKISKQLTELSQNPEKLANYLSSNALIISEAAPNTGSSINATFQTALQFLMQKLPKDPSATAGFLGRKWEPSSIEMAKFERYLAAVEDPMSVVKDLESGTATREGVEAVKVVFPTIYERMQSEALKYVAENPTISYEKKLQLGTLLDVNTDASLLSENITGLQQQFANLEQQQNAARKDQTAVETSQTGLNKLDFEDEKSGTEAVATRK